MTVGFGLLILLGSNIWAFDAFLVNVLRLVIKMTEHVEFVGV